MGSFKMIGERKEVGFSVSLNKKGTIIAKTGQAEVEISIVGKSVKRYTSYRNFIINPDGAMILPYFRKEGAWMVVMVRQFRIALAGTDNYETLEAVAGEASGNDKKECMVLELKEETGIQVEASGIKMMPIEFYSPSNFSCDIWSGIIEIKESQVPSEILSGEWFDGEYTIVVIYPIIELLKARDSGKIKLDVWSSRLLDEVAKEVGFLTKNY